jgi:hypothetical protein
MALYKAVSADFILSPSPGPNKMHGLEEPNNSLNYMNKYKHLSCSKILLAILLPILPLTALGLSYIISENEINNVLKLTFPYETRMGSSQLKLENPYPLFYASTQEMGLKIHISMKEENKPDISASAALRGGIQFDSKLQQLQLVRPIIENLSWIEPPKEDQKHLAKRLEQWIGKDLPVIVLLDIKQLSNSVFTPTLNDVKVKDNGVEVMF